MRPELSACQLVEPVVLLAGGKRPLAHVDVDHLAGTCLQRRHRKGAGVGKQVQHLAAARIGLAGNVLSHPPPAGSHVQKQAMVLAAQYMHQKARAIFLHRVRIGQAALHQPGLRSPQSATLVDPDERLARVDLLPAGLQCITNGLEIATLQRSKAGQYDGRREDVERQVLAAGMQAAAAMEKALRVLAQRHGGDGVE
ncbi:hypothetical protein D3C72_1011430 [compost metagenome]